MNVLEGSLAYRAARPVWRRLLMATRSSLVGRFFLAMVRVATRVASDSGTLGTRRVGSRPLGRTGHSLSMLAISRPYLWLRRGIGDGPVGQTARAGGAQLLRSRFSGGAWITVVGAGVFALGCGRLGLLLAEGATAVDNTDIPLAAPELRLITPVVVLLVGALMLLAGPRLRTALAGGVVGRSVAFIVGAPLVAGLPAGGSGDPRERRRSTWVVVTGAVLAGAAGAAGGLTFGSGPAVLILVVLVACALVAVLIRPELVLLAVAAFPWVDWLARRALGGAGPLWDEAFLLISICLLVWCVLVLRRWELWTVPIALPLILAFVAAIGSVVVNDVPGDVALYALRILFEPLLFYFLGFLFPKDRRWVQAAVAVFVLTGVSLALHGLYQYLTHAPMPASWVDVRETGIGTRAYSIIQNPNGLGAFLLMGAMVSLSLALARRSRAVLRVLWAAACVMQLAGIAVTFSRGAWIGLAAGVAALLIIAYRRYLVPIVAVVVVAWFALPRVFIDRLTFAFSSAYITKSSAAGRLYVWNMALDYAGRHPWFGVGLGTFGGTSAVTFGYGRLWVDSFYLQLAAEGGLLLLAFFLWVLLRVVKGLVKGYGMTPDAYLRALGAGSLAAFVAVAVANLTASVWETLAVGVGFWFLAGLVTSAMLHEDARSGRPAVENTPKRGIDG
jgi:O-antigen ligase